MPLVVTCTFRFINIKKRHSALFPCRQINSSPPKLLGHHDKVYKVSPGASSGIGMETARVLALRGAHVIIAVRNVEAGTAVKEAIIKENNNARVDVLELDLSSMASVHKFVTDFKSLNLPLNILINNAGVMGCPFQLSPDGIEQQFATNHIGHFLLTNLLLENMKVAAHETGIEGRVINLSSGGHKFTYWGGIQFDKISDKSGYYAYLAYGQSKLANILHANELARRLQEEGANVTANSVHPGSILTNLQRNNKTIFVFGKVGDSQGGALKGMHLKVRKLGQVNATIKFIHPWNLKGNK